MVILKIKYLKFQKEKQWFQKKGIGMWSGTFAMENSQVVPQKV